MPDNANAVTFGASLQRVYALEANRDVDALVRMLDNPLQRGSSSVREAAASSLRRLGHPRAGEPLIATADDPSPHVRFAAVRALGSVKYNGAVSRLIEALDDEALLVRQAAACSLGELRHRDAIEPLHKALSSDDRWMRFYAAEALARIGDPALPDLLPDLVRRDTRLAVRRRRRWRKLADSLR